MEENNHNEQGFDEVGQDEMEGEEYLDEDQMNQYNNEYQQGGQAEGQGEIMFQNEPINEHDDYNINNQLDQHIPNNFNNINQDQMMQMRYPNPNEQFQKNDNDEYFQENERE